ncbi:MAG: hypothetical protein DRJ49_01280 [Thermoprotei archaeon]|nr:MAG: hypothetical protein DRJ49_01280 [Thermoprotei archaeon]
MRVSTNHVNFLKNWDVEDISMFGTTERLIGKILKDKIEVIKHERGVTYIRPKDAAFDEMFIYKRMIGLFEYKYMFTANILIVPADGMTPLMADVYRYLKGCECILKHRGIFRKTISFEPREELSKLATLIEGLKVSNRLTNLLNSDRELMEDISKLGTIELYVLLKSIDETYLPFITDRDKLILAEKAFFEKPSEILWTLTLTHTLPRGFRFKRNVLLIFDVMDRIARKLRDLSNDVISELSA